MMPAHDLIHDAVKNALLKDGWVITADPYWIQYDDLNLYADLSAERTLVAERGPERIVVEIKSFAGRSQAQDLKIAVGQFVLYREFLRETAPDHRLYLAIDSDVHQKLFTRKAIELIQQRLALSIIVVDLEREEIIQWIS